MSFFSVPDAETTYLVLIRHGATEANAARPYRLQGYRTDLPLFDLGRRQAREVGRFLATCPLKRVLTSPLRRAVETAEHVARSHGLRVEPWPDVIECDVGRWDGMTWERIEREDPEAYRLFMADPATAGYPEGESYRDVQQRVAPAFEGLLRESAGTSVAVVSHNVVNRAYLAGLLGVPISEARRIPQNNGGISLIRRTPAGTKVLTVNSILHLEGLDDE